MPCCVAVGCSVREIDKTVSPPITFHLFPADKELRQKWIQAVNRLNWEPSRCSRLCSKHFKEEDFDRSPFFSKLKRGVVPSNFESFYKKLLKSNYRGKKRSAWPSKNTRSSKKLFKSVKVYNDSKDRLAPISQRVNLSKKTINVEKNCDTSENKGITTIKVEPGLTDDGFYNDTRDITAGYSQLEKEVPEHIDSPLDTGNPPFIKQEDENNQNTNRKIKVEPCLTNDVPHDNSMDTIAGDTQLKKNHSEYFDSMLHLGNTSFIKQEEEECCQNKNTEIKVEQSPSDSDFEPYELTTESIKRCNQSKVVSFDGKTDTITVTPANNCQIISIVCAPANFFGMSGIREDCRVFGEFVARELQKLKSDDSRMHLKGIIEKAILEVSGAESKR